MRMIRKIRNLPSWVKFSIPLFVVGGGFVLAIGGFGIAFIITAWFGQPIPVFGFEATYEQPISFPHTIHAGVGLNIDNGEVQVSSDGQDLMNLGLDCTFCHRTVTDQENAGVPPIELCSYCHGVAGGPDVESLVILRNSAGISGDNPAPVNWRRVHQLPDHVRFAHEPHITYLSSNPDAIQNAPDESILILPQVMPSSVCSTCHGDVASMEQVFQVVALKMRQCVACHRANDAPTSCETCHY